MSFNLRRSTSPIVKYDEINARKELRGQVIKLTAAEKWHARILENEINHKHRYNLRNSLGYEVQITTLTTVMKKIAEQKFYQIPFAQYIPVRVGEGAWSTQLTTFRSYQMGDEFENGIINTGSNNARLAMANAGIDALNIKVYPWALSVEWTIFDLEYASRYNNWDLIAALEKSRKTNWDMGLQRIAFLGARGMNGAGGSVLGLLNQPQVAVNTSVITKPISTMTPEEIKAFTGQLIAEYRINSNYTAYPDRLVVPESDYNGMATQSSPTFPLKSVKEVLEEAFSSITMKDFKILPSVYNNANQHADIPSIAGKNVYVLFNFDEDSIRMDIPLDYTNTLANSLNNFQFSNVAYGQFTGVLAYRPKEVMYFTYTP